MPQAAKKHSKGKHRPLALALPIDNKHKIPLKLMKMMHWSNDQELAIVRLRDDFLSPEIPAGSALIVDMSFTDITDSGRYIILNEGTGRFEVVICTFMAGAFEKPEDHVFAVQAIRGDVARNVRRADLQVKARVLMVVDADTADRWPLQSFRHSRDLRQAA